MTSANISATAGRTVGGRKGTEKPEYRAPVKGARRVAVPFPDAWADAWDSYEFAEIIRGHSERSVKTRRSSVLRLAKQYPGKPPEDITRRDIEKHLMQMRGTLKPGTVVGSYND